jgi:Tol biopolymer transport system component
MLKKYIFILSFFSFLVIIQNCTVSMENELEWGNLRNLGPNINSSGKDEHVTLTIDGNTMYFASIREGGIGGYDIYKSKFVDGNWSKAEILPPPINTKKDEYDPFITLDGTKLFFASNRDGGDEYWDCEIYISEWDKEKWSEPHIFDSVFFTPDKPDWGVTITKDFKTLIFSSGREPSGPYSAQIFKSEKLKDGWSIPVALGEPVNSGKWEATPYITPDGKALYLNSLRGEENKQDVDIWKFEYIDGKWTNPKLMEGVFLSPKHDYDPCLSADGRKFYFTSSRDGGFGDSDIYVAERVLKRE